ncbi:MAG: hypothetical protein WCJ30_26575, partial [Deltaproteobacteria bacterium]
SVGTRILWLIEGSDGLSTLHVPVVPLGAPASNLLLGSTAAARATYCLQPATDSTCRERSYSPSFPIEFR